MRETVKIEVEHNGEDILGYSDHLIDGNKNGWSAKFECAKCGKSWKE